MIHEENNNLYLAENGKLIVRVSDGFVMGTGIDVGQTDSIDNYEEREFTEEEIDNFRKSAGIKTRTMKIGNVTQPRKVEQPVKSKTTKKSRSKAS